MKCIASDNIKNKFTCLDHPPTLLTQQLGLPQFIAYALHRAHSNDSVFNCYCCQDAQAGEWV